MRCLSRRSSSGSTSSICCFSSSSHRSSDKIHLKETETGSGLIEQQRFYGISGSSIKDNEGTSRRSSKKSHAGRPAAVFTMSHCSLLPLQACFVFTFVISSFGNSPEFCYLGPTAFDLAHLSMVFTPPNSFVHYKKQVSHHCWIPLGHLRLALERYS